MATIGGTFSIGDDLPYTMGTPYNFPNLLQIWGIKSVPVATGSVSVSGVCDGGDVRRPEGGDVRRQEGGDHPIIINAAPSSSSSSSSSSFANANTGGRGYRSTSEGFSYQSEAKLLYCIGMHR